MKHILLIAAALLVSLTTSTARAEGETLSVALTGDIMMGTTFPGKQLPPQKGRQLFVHVSPILQRTDVTAGNLEGTLCDGGTTTKKVSNVCYAFRTPTAFAPRLREAGYDMLSLANNHARDFGEYGCTTTMRALRAQGIAYAGLKEHPATAVIVRGGVRYGFCAFGHNGYTYRTQDLETAARIIDSLRPRCDILIVSFHGGAEGRTKNRVPHGTETFLGEDRGNLREFTHFCVDHGADVVYGHGPHVVRGVELYRNRFIAYSLGNFCTPYGVSLTGISGYAPIIELTIARDGSFRTGHIHSFIQQRGLGPRRDTTHVVAQEISRLSALDFPQSPLSITCEGVITRR